MALYPENPLGNLEPPAGNCACTSRQPDHFGCQNAESDNFWHHSGVFLDLFLTSHFSSWRLSEALISFSISFYMFLRSPPIFTGLHLSVGASSGSPALITSSVASGSNDRSNAATEVATFRCHSDETWHLGTRTHDVSTSRHAYKYTSIHEHVTYIYIYICIYTVYMCLQHHMIILPYAIFYIHRHQISYLLKFACNHAIALAVCILGLPVPAPSSRCCT